jgi:transcriptional antiterminator RfaH
MSKTWCVAHTQPLRELIAKQNLLDQGFEVYLPRFKKICKHARKTEEKLIPLFPRYIFVGLDSDLTNWRSINGTRGVSCLLVTSELNPAKVPTYTINNLRSQEISEGIVPLTSLVSFVTGDKVRITDGILKDQTAIFASMNEESRVQVLLSFMGRETKIILPLYAVEAA